MDTYRGYFCGNPHCETLRLIAADQEKSFHQIYKEAEERAREAVSEATRRRRERR